MCGVAATVMQAAGGAVSIVRPDARTGRLVRSIVRSGPRAPATPSAPMVETVNRVARQYQLSPQLVQSVIQAESNYDSRAVSPKGAQGLMQLIPATARRFGVSDAFNPEDNIQGGARYLKYLLGMYKGDETLALAAYNAGEGAVSRYGGVPPFAETRGYVTKVRQAASGFQPVVEKPAEAPAEVHHTIREVMDANGKIYYISY